MNQIHKKYQKIPLFILDYRNNEPVFVDEITNEFSLFIRLEELSNHEITMTDKGLEFLREYYGLENIAHKLHDKGSHKYQTYKEILDWLERKGWFDPNRKLK